VEVDEETEKARMGASFLDEATGALHQARWDKYWHKKRRKLLHQMERARVLRDGVDRWGVGGKGGKM
jgi:hypothetical protein